MCRVAGARALLVVRLVAVSRAGHTSAPSDAVLVDEADVAKLTAAQAVSMLDLETVAALLGVNLLLAAGLLAGGLLVVGRGPRRGRRFGRPTLTHPFVTRDPGPKQPVDRASPR